MDAPGMDAFDQDGMGREDFVQRYAGPAKKFVRSLFALLPADVRKDLPSAFFEPPDDDCEPKAAGYKTNAKRLEALVMFDGMFLGGKEMTAADKALLQDLFNNNADDEMGKLYVKIWKSVDKLTEVMTLKFFDLIDINESGSIERAEAIVLMQMIEALQKGEEMNVKDDLFIGWTKSFFALVDKDGSGSLSRPEIVGFAMKKVLQLQSLWIIPTVSVS